jgi:outer membrane protein TolC
MTYLTTQANKSLVRSASRLSLLTLALVLAGCAVKPQLATQDEVRERVKSDTARMYLGQAPITNAISLEEAIARALKYNLDYRLKKMESAVALGITDYTSYDMLPSLVASAGYRTRSDYIASDGNINVLTGVENPLNPSSTDERKRLLTGAEFSWNALDFGVSYYRARQQANQFLIAEERRRKVVQNIVQDVRASFWRALGAQRLSEQARQISERASLAMARSREAEIQKVLPPVLALNYQRALLDATTLLNQRRQDLDVSKAELAAMMNTEPGAVFSLAETAEAKLSDAPVDIRKLEEVALLQRPELREEDFKKRISADETRKQLLGMLPGISFDTALQYDSNKYASSNSWSQGGVRLSWNLMRVFALPALGKTQEAQTKTDETRRMALSMAVITQLRVASERYRLALEDFKLADTAAQVDQRMSDYMRASVTARLDSELELIRVQARTVLGNYQRVNAYANAQIAFGRLQNTLGFDPLPDDFEANELPVLTERVRTHLNAVQKDAFKMSSTLFGYNPTVSIHLAGVSDPVTQVRMKAQLSELLTRNQVAVNAVEGTPITFSLRTESNGTIDKINWSIDVLDSKGQTQGKTDYTTSAPNSARPSVYEAALVAAVTSKLPQIRVWLGSMAGAAQ